jgi:hypothetical protein
VQGHAQADACSRTRPRAASPAIKPASTSPEPEVPSPVPCALCATGAGRGAMQVVAPFITTVAFHAAAWRSAMRAGLLLQVLLVAPVRCAISPAWGVRTPAARKRRTDFTASIASASSSTVRIAEQRQQQLHESPPWTRAPTIPGPTSRASVSPAIARRAASPTKGRAAV